MAHRPPSPKSLPITTPAVNRKYILIWVSSLRCWDKHIHLSCNGTSTAFSDKNRLFCPRKTMLRQLGRSLDKDDSHLLPLGELRPIHTSTHMLFSTFASFCFYSGYSRQSTEMLLGANLRGQSKTYVNILC